MSKLEKACVDLQQRARDLAGAAKLVERIATKIRRAADVGDHGAIGVANAELVGALSTFELAGSACRSGWPFSDAELTSYLETAYQQDLVRFGGDADVTITPLDDRLAAFPVIVQIQDSLRSVKLDNTRLTALRPSHIVNQIKARQKKAGAKPEQFIEILYRAYQRASATTHQGVKLADLYDLLTLHPETKRLYSRAEFQRDVFLLDNSEVRVTKSGAKLSFSAATGTKGTSGVFLVTPPTGIPKYYLYVRFQEEE